MAKELTSLETVYKGCSKSNASYFIALAHDVRSGCWGMVVEVEPSHQYSIVFCCHVTGGSREAV